MKKIYLAFSILLISHSICATDFPIRGHVRVRVDFWKKVYTEISTTEAFLHDSENLALVFKKVSLPPRGRKRNAHLKRIRAAYRKNLRTMAKKKQSAFNTQESELYALIEKAYPSGSKPNLRAIANGLRFQYGLRDRYYQGLLRSQKYLVYIKSVLKKQGIPKELAYLPHVESSFNYQAYSKVGAAGIWQFMRSTARLYKLKVSYTVDERRDVIKATNAAARFLKDNYRQLKTWPLALTAYNHGASSLKRAVKRLGTREIHEIIKRYNGRRFGFASKNFYSTFMATVEISENPEKYFPAFKPIAPISFSELTMPKSLNIDQIKTITGLSSEDLREYNPSIRSSVFRSSISLPNKFKLHLPKTEATLIKSWKNKMAAVEKRKPKPGESVVHIISRGESLFDISRLYGVKISDLVADNEISNPSRVFPGMKLDVYQGTKKVAILEKTSLVTPPDEPEISAPEPSTPASVTSLPAPKVSNQGATNKELNLDLYHLDLQKLGKNLYKVQIEVEETLGHFAEWAKQRTSSIRKLNRLSFGRPIYFGQQLKIRIKDINHFEKLRREYHLSLQEDFYDSFIIKETTPYIVRRGDSLSRILNKFELPLWLLRSTQGPEGLNSSLKVGQKIMIPTIEETETSATIPFSNTEN